MKLISLSTIHPVKSLLAVGISTAFIYWVATAAIETLLSDNGVFVQHLFSPERQALWIRLIAIAAIVLSAGSSLFWYSRSCTGSQALNRGNLHDLMSPAAGEHALASGGRLATNELQTARQIIEELKISESKYQSLFESTGKALCVAEYQTKQLIFANQTFCELFGYELQEILTMSITDLHPEDEIATITDHIKSIISGEKRTGTEMPCLRRDGTRFYADIIPALSSVDGQDYLVGVFHDVTDRRVLRDKLHSEAAYVRNNPGPVMRVDIDGYITFCNPACISIFQRDLVGGQIETIIPNIEIVRTDSRGYREDCDTVDALVNGRQFQFSVIWEESTASYYMYGADITARKRIEEKLKIKDAALDSCITPITILSEDGTIVQANAAFCKLHGSSYETIDKHSITSFVSAPGFDMWDRGKPSLEFSWIGRGHFHGLDGSHTPVFVSLNTFHIDAKQPIHVMCSTVDISAEIALEDALSESENNYQHLVNVATNGMAVIMNESIVFANPFFERIIGLPTTKMSGRGFTRLIVDADRDRIAKQLESLSKTPDSQGEMEFEARLNTGDNRIITVSGSLITTVWEKQPAVLTLFRDISDEVAIREREEELQRRLIVAEKLTAIGRLSAGVAHEISNPLSVVYGMLQEAEKNKKALTAEDGKVLLHSCERINATVQNLLHFSSGAPTERTPTDINDIIKDTVFLVSATLDKNGIRLVLQLNPDLPSLKISARQIQQALLDIVFNAMDAMSDGGTLRITSKKDQETVFIGIEDNGCGIAEENLDKIMTPFFTTKPVGKGTGLGLSTANGVIIDHDGTIEFYRLKKGTKVEIRLPTK